MPINLWYTWDCEKGMTQDEMAGWHHWLNGRESEWTLGVGDGQGGLACCDSWGRKESDTTERLNWTELNWDPDILECEVKRALGSIIQTKLVEVMEFQLSYFKSWKMMLWKCCTQCASKFGKLSIGHRTRKGQFSFQSERKAMPKNAQTPAQLHSSHTLVT